MLARRSGSSGLSRYFSAADSDFEDAASDFEGEKLGVFRQRGKQTWVMGKDSVQRLPGIRKAALSATATVPSRVMLSSWRLNVFRLSNMR